MSHPPNFRKPVSLIILACSAAVVGAAWLASAHALTQHDGEKQVKKTSYPNEPVEIVEVKNRAGKLSLNEKFRGPATEWLRGLTFTISNPSGKDITYVALNLFFPRRPDAPPSEPGYVSDLIFGVSPQSAHYSDFRQRHPNKVLKHNDKLTLTLTDEQFENIQQVLTALGYPPSIDSVEVWLSEVGFDDGTLWKGGQIIKAGARTEASNAPSVVRGGAQPVFLKSSFSPKPGAAEAACGGPLSRYWSDECSITGCELPNDRVDYNDPYHRTSQEYYAA